MHNKKKETKYVQLQSAAGQKCIQNNIKKKEYSMIWKVYNIQIIDCSFNK